ncbi:MAG TPA: WG repeat-containing protein, partial [Parapedobacter sp.]|nr:WG repeat-containing protein [Parapedobacter sp.]
MMEKQFSYYRLPAIVLIASTSLLTSCFGPKNLVTQKSGMRHYDYVGDTLSGWALVRQDSLWGYVAADGKQVIKPTFTWATDFADGMALAQDDRGYRYINGNGKLLRRIKAPHGYSFSKGMAPVEIKGKWGYINRKGKKVIKPQFDWAEPFSENRAAVTVGLKKGYVNTQGEIAIPAIYQEAHAFKNGVAIVRKDFRYGIIDTLGNFVLTNKYDEIEPWQTDFYRLGVYNPAADRVNIFGLADAKGNLLLDTQYAAIDLIQNRYIHARRDTLVGLWDRYGNVVIPMEYTSFGVISDDGILAANKNGKAGFINLQNQLVLPFEYEGTGTSGNRKIAYKDSTYVLMDNQFKVIKRIKNYKDVYSFSNGFAVVSIKDPNDYYGNLYGYIDQDGNEVVAPQYNGGAAGANPHGLAVVGKTEGHGIVDEYLLDIHQGKLVGEKEYSSLYKFGSLWFNRYGDFISSETGRSIGNFPYEKMYPVEYGERKDLAKVFQEGKVGLVDTSLTELLSPEYRDIGDYYNCRIKVKKDSLWGYADEQFRIRIPMVYDDATIFR